MKDSQSHELLDQLSQNPLQTSLRPLLDDYTKYIRDQCRSLGLPDDLLNIKKHIKTLLTGSPNQLHLFANSSGRTEGFCTMQLKNLPQANNITVAFIDNVFLQRSSSLQSEAIFRESLADYCRELIVSLSPNISSVCLVTLSTDLDKKAVYESLGAGTEPFCRFPILERSKAEQVKGNEGTPLRYSGVGKPTLRAAREIASIVYEYRIRRSEKSPAQWPEPEEGHLDRHIKYIHEQLLGRAEIPSTLIEHENCVVAAGIGFAIPIQLNLSSDFPLSLLTDTQALLLDDFYVGLDYNWGRFGPTLFADIIDQISDDTIKYIQFQQNIIDCESKCFSDAIGAKPCLEFYNLSLSTPLT